MENTAGALTEDEQFVLTHISRFGSDGYPIQTCGRGWVWGPIRGINGPPVIFKTRRETVASFEAYLDTLRARYGAQRQALALMVLALYFHPPLDIPAQ